MATKLKAVPDGRALALKQKMPEANPLTEARIKEELAIPKTRVNLPFCSELARLRQRDMELAGTYEGALKRILKGVGPEEFVSRWSANSIAAYSQQIAREEVYKYLGMLIMPLSESVKKINGGRPPIENNALFDMACFGRMREEALEMAGLVQADNIELHTVFASTRMFRADVKADTIRKNIFIDESGVRADLLAASLLDGTGIVTPRMKNVEYQSGDGTQKEYGVLADIADSPGVEEAVSIRALARNEGMANFVFDRFDEFCEKLGYSFEACRILGIQDMHHRNAYAIRNESGSLGIGRIDLDIVATYPTTERYKDAFVGQLFHILDSLYFAVVFGAKVRSSPQTIAKEMGKIPAKEIRAGMEDLALRMFSGFLNGAKEAYGFYSKKETMEKVRETLMEHDGLPVGWGAGERKADSMIRKKDQLLYESINTLERAYVNGQLPRYISQGAHAGRTFLDSEAAWTHGFSQQVKWMRHTFKDFWSDAFKILKIAIPVWKPDGNRMMPVVTIAN